MSLLSSGDSPGRQFFLKPVGMVDLVVLLMILVKRVAADDALVGSVAEAKSLSLLPVKASQLARRKFV